MAAAGLARATPAWRDGPGSRRDRGRRQARSPDRQAPGRRTGGCGRASWARVKDVARSGRGCDHRPRPAGPGLAACLHPEAGHKRVDVISDYLGGHPTEVLLGALSGHDLKAEFSRIRLIEIGEMAGPAISLSAAALRSSGLELYGSGGGGIPHTAILEAFPQLWALAACGRLRIDTEAVPLADVESAWQRQDVHGRRLVIVP